MSNLLVSSLIGIPGIVAICVSSAAFVAAVFAFLYFFVFANLRIKRAADEQISIFERDHASLFGEINKFIKRLEAISSFNLVYNDEYAKWKKKYNDIRDVDDASAQAAVNSLRDFINEKHFKELKEYFQIAKSTIAEYHSKVTELDDSLQALFKVEEDTKASFQKAKEKYREMKQFYYSEKDELSLVVESFEKLFKKIDSLFDECDNSIERASYSDVSETVSTKIDPIVEECVKALRILPKICVTISNVIPDKISSLRNRYEEMAEEGYPLNHIIAKNDIAGYEERLSRLADSVKALSLNGIEPYLDEMILKIEGNLADFEKEKKNRAIFEKECNEVYEKQSTIENRFYKMNHDLPKVREIYLITGDDDAAMEEIKNAIGEASNAKRSLDNCLHSGIKQPYSILLERLSSLKEASDKADSMIVSFDRHLTSLKDEANGAENALRKYDSLFVEAENDIRSLNVAKVDSKLSSELEELYKCVDSLYKTLRTRPINVNEVKRLHERLIENGDRFLSDVDNAKKGVAKAEKNIVFANRYRSNDKAIDNALSQSESLFAEGEFSNSSNMSESVLRQIDANSGINE